MNAHAGQGGWRTAQPDPKARVRLVIISDHPVMAEALKALVLAQSSFAVEGIFSNAESVIRHAEDTRLDCPLVLLDLESSDGVNHINQLMLASSARRHPCRILVLTGSTDAGLHDAAVTAGASGLVRKTESGATLLKAIARVADGELWLDRASAGRIFQALARKKMQPDHDPEQEKIDSLTRKERTIVSEIAAQPSASGQELATRLHISEHTLRNHLSAIYAKLEVANRTDLYAYARQHNIDAPPAREKRSPRV